MSRKKCTFNNDWVKETINPEWSKVFCKVQNDSFSAYCKLCKKSVDLSNMGKQALTSHEKSRKHARAIQVMTNNQKFNFKKDDNNNNNNPQQVDESNSNSNCAIQQTHSTITGFVFNSNVIDAEILWCLTVVATNMSYNSCSMVIPTLKVMFPDSQIAQKMTLGYTKAAYTVSYGLAEYFKECLDEILVNCDHYVICFDEAMNKIVQSGQMDIHIRFFHEGRVATRFLTSVFMKYTTSEDILKYFLEGLKTYNLNRILQISMDGPHVNWKFFSLLKEHQAQSTEKQILDIGSCGLHIVHGALQTGHKACKWQVNEFLRGIYYLFKDSPRRRNDFAGLTKCEIFPKKFCVTRWVENAEAAKTALKLVDNIKIYVEHKNTKLPSNFSIKNVKVGLSDKLMKAKLAFFELIASLLEPFLRKYQTDQPMVPFLFNDLEVLIRNLVERFIKPEVVNDSSLSKLLKLNFSDKTLQKQASSVDVGFSTRKTLSDKTINEKDKLIFLKDCRTFLQACVEKLIERCCLKYSLVKSAAALNPKTMVLSERKNCSLFNSLLQILFEHNIISSSCAELAKIEYSNFLTQFREVLTQYSQERLDTFFSTILQDNSDFKNVWSAFKLILILSHGNASVESGFSVNKTLLVENLHEDTLVNQRFVYDTIKACGGINNIVITDKLRRYVKNAHSKYKIALEKTKNQMQTESERVKLKRQAKQEILNLENKRKKLALNTERETSQINRDIEDLRKYI